jgi:hypothetical protein
MKLAASNEVLDNCDDFMSNSDAIVIPDAECRSRIWKQLELSLVVLGPRWLLQLPGTQIGNGGNTANVTCWQ